MQNAHRVTLFLSSQGRFFARRASKQSGLPGTKFRQADGRVA